LHGCRFGDSRRLFLPLRATSCESGSSTPVLLFAFTTSASPEISRTRLLVFSRPLDGCDRASAAPVRRSHLSQRKITTGDRVCCYRRGSIAFAVGHSLAACRALITELSVFSLFRRFWYRWWSASEDLASKTGTTPPSSSLHRSASPVPPSWPHYHLPLPQGVRPIIGEMGVEELRRA